MIIFKGRHCICHHQLFIYCLQGHSLVYTDSTGTHEYFIVHRGYTYWEGHSLSYTCLYWRLLLHTGFSCPHRRLEAYEYSTRLPHDQSPWGLCTYQDWRFLTHSPSIYPSGRISARTRNSCLFILGCRIHSSTLKHEFLFG